MAANGHHNVLIRSDAVFRKGVYTEVGFAGRRVETLFPGAVGQVETAGFPHLPVVILKTGHYCFDGVADVVVVGGHLIPVDLTPVAKGGLGQAGDDGRLAEQVFGRWRQDTLRGVDDTHGIFYTDKLLAALLNIDIGAPQAGQDERLFAMDEMAAVEFGRNMDGQAALFQRLGGVFRVGSGREEVAAHGEKDFGLALVHRLDGVYRGVAVAAGRFKPKGSLQLVQKFRFGRFPDADGAVALHVAVATHRAGAGARLANAALEQEQVDDFLDVLNSVFVLRQAHGPADDDLLFVAQQLRRLQYPVPSYATGLHQLFKIVLFQFIDERLVPFCLFGNKIPVEHRIVSPLFLVPQLQHDGLEQGYIAVDLYLQEEVGQRSAAGKDFARSLRVDEFHQACFR